MSDGFEHNKKRNVGLVVEFVTHYVAKMLLEGNVEKANLGIAIIRKHLRPGTALHKEYRLFNALSNSSVTNDTVAQIVIREAREAAKTHNAKQLDDEKTQLIHEINKKLHANVLYESEIPNYKLFATIQILLNAWRGSEINPVKTAKLEENMIKHLTLEKKDVNLMEHVNSDVDELVIKLMTNKFNDKYGNMSAIQKQIVREYVTPTAADGIRLMGILEGVRSEAVKFLNTKIADATISDFTRTKMQKVNEIILSEDISRPQDGTIVRFLGVTQLLDELKNGENKNG